MAFVGPFLLCPYGVRLFGRCCPVVTFGLGRIGPSGLYFIAKRRDVLSSACVGLHLRYKILCACVLAVPHEI
jgi:hypothetical protein